MVGHPEGGRASKKLLFLKSASAQECLSFILPYNGHPVLLKNFPKSRPGALGTRPKLLDRDEESEACYPARLRSLHRRV